MSKKKKEKDFDNEYDDDKRDSKKSYGEQSEDFFDFLPKKNNSRPSYNSSNNKTLEDDSCEERDYKEESFNHKSCHNESDNDKSFKNHPKEEKPLEHHSKEHSTFDTEEAHPHYGYTPNKNDSHNADVALDADHYSSIEQDSDELIFIKDSCNISIQTTDTQAAASIQIALQLAIALVIRITLADSDKGQNVLQDLLQYFDSEQSNKQKICIENSKDINIITTDTDVSANIQALLDVLLSLVAKLDAL